ncbi:MAG: HIT family protein [Proteobacteria bacterium]|nr:HIT family protein [Pseudomonadota bacterium]MDA0868428.1 HIT family protein [Pseudomonadota bacterium]MDA1327818.1 HIT family protein [Pseudomonadota bacterium]
MSQDGQDCLLCRELGGELLWQSPWLRVVQANEPDYPGWLRLIPQTHAAELTDLSPGVRQALWLVLHATEGVLRRVMQPHKVNLASLGNQVPHVHWHMVPRYRDDRHFPDSVWAAPRREVSAEHGQRAARALGLGVALQQALQPWAQGVAA